MNRLTCLPTSPVSPFTCSPLLRPLWPSFSSLKEQNSSHWGLQRCSCAFLSVWNAPVHSPWTTQLLCLGNSIYPPSHFLGEAFLIKIRFSYIIAHHILHCSLFILIQLAITCPSEQLLPIIIIHS